MPDRHIEALINLTKSKEVANVYAELEGDREEEEEFELAA